ncbi:MAG: KpsF/GutQ family sugar-phosphate isomerase [Burkholderiales bacterium]|nr:KpsF/GutQ family sugar-phosphate isomerase [Burkholderiales bacterium]
MKPPVASPQGQDPAADAASAGPAHASTQALVLARRVLEIESAAIAALSARLDGRFLHALDLVLACRGRVVVSGIGKSGHIARKIASTMASTGTPAFFVHPAEAMHGDLGMITRDDVLIALSYSGETEELLRIVPVVKRQGARLIVITGNPGSALAREADALLDASVAEEACPLGLAPTASTTAALAFGDALAVALLDARGFGPEDFARSHPGGKLGLRLLTHVGDVMRTGDALPLVAPTSTLSEVIVEVSRKGMGLALVVDPGQRLLGVFTDGDLRRLIDRVSDLRSVTVDTVMSRSPRSIGAQALAVEGVALMEQHRINQLPVVDAGNRVVGALNMHDLFAAGVV